MNNKFSTKFLSLLLCVVMLLSTMSVMVMADEADAATDAASDTAAPEGESTEATAEGEAAEGEATTEGEATDEAGAEGEAAEGEAAEGDEEEEEKAFNYLAATNVFKTADEKLKSMVLKTDAFGYQLYCDEYTGEVAVKNLTTGQVLFTNPYDLAESPSTDDIKGQLLSQIELRYSDSTGTKYTMYSYVESCLKEQIRVKNLKNGLRVEYSLGDEEIRYLVPMQIEKTRYEELIYALCEGNDSAIRQLKAYYTLFDPNDTSLSVREVKDMQEKYPITEEMAIYVFDTTASPREIMKVESYIKSLCPDYTFATLEEDHMLTGYTSTQKAPALFKMALEYYLDEDGLQIRLPANGIRFDEDEYQLVYVRILPYFGAGSTAYEGYTFYPDGSGALFDFQELKGQNVTVTGKVYGLDYAYHEIGTVKAETIRLPVFGVVENYVGQSAAFTTVTVEETVDEETGEVIPAHEEEVVSEYLPLEQDRGFLAIIEEGDSLASISTTHGGNLHRYNSVYAEFYPRPSDSYNLSDSISVGDDTVWTIVSDRKYTGSYRIRIVMLTDETNAANLDLGEDEYYPVNYMGMAKAYQDYLIDAEVLTQIEDTDEDIPLYIESFGTIDTDGTFLSIPVTVTKALTTFDNLKTMYEELSAEGVTNVNFRLTGFANGGLSSPAVPGKVEFEEVVGGDEGYADFIKYAEEKDITVYPEFELSYSEKDVIGDGYSLRKDGVRTIDNRYSQKRTYRSSLQQTVTAKLLCISPASFDKLYTGLTEDISELGISGISLGTLGSDLNSDFDEGDSYNREDSKELVTQLLEKVSGEYDSIMVDSGNAYTWKYADTILNVALDSSNYTYSSHSVPFIGLVLHGCVNFAGVPTNMASDMDFVTLKMIENGSLPYFTLSYDNTPLLKEDDTLSKYYSVAYDIWFEDVVETYENLNAVMKALQSEKIVDHEFISGQRVPEDGEMAADTKAYEDALKAETEAAAKIEEMRAKAEALANRLGTLAEYSTDSYLDENAKSSEQIAAENAVKYNVDDGSIVRVVYENGTTFILNYNRFAVSVDGQTVDALGYLIVE